MNSKSLMALAGAALVGGGWWVLRPDVSIEEPTAPAIAIAVPDLELKLQGDPTEVFQRAFWRRPSAEDQIVNAERRHWLGRETEDGVEKWQWFIEVKPGPEFTDWLLRENPFDLELVSAENVRTELTTPPDWMPGARELVRFTHYRKRGGNFHVFYDPTQRRIYATDQGGGFNIAQK